MGRPIEEETPAPKVHHTEVVQPSEKGKSGSTKSAALVTQILAISIPRNLSVDISVKGDELKREDLAKIKSQFNRWIEGLEEAFEE